jgi:hypothetical protein
LLGVSNTEERCDLSISRIAPDKLVINAQVFNKGKNKADSAKKIADLDSQLSLLQKDSVERGKNMAGSAATETPIAPLPAKPPRVEEADMADLSQLLKTNS